LAAHRGGAIDENINAAELAEHWATAALKPASSPVSAIQPFTLRFSRDFRGGSSNAARSRATRATSTLSFASCQATALPMPRPVTSATLSLSSK
jgi:hypothetical protein